MTTAEQYIHELVKTEPELEILRQLYNGKKWHQLTEKLLELVNSSQVNRINLVELYDSFIREFESNLNSLALVRIIVAIARKHYQGSFNEIGCNYLINFTKTATRL